MKKAALPLTVVLLVLLADQILKIWIKTNMYSSEEIDIIGTWFKLHFTENEGMAFGMTLGGEYGKLALSIFRIVAVIFIGIYLFRINSKENTARGLIISLALIFAGALGNIIDSAFYGLIFEESSDLRRNVARIFPPDGGYASFLHGNVVDMLYFPIYNGFLPDWIPFWGGKHFLFFRPVFNIADVAITVGVFMIIIFQRRYFREEDKLDDAAEPVKPADR